MQEAGFGADRTVAVLRDNLFRRLDFKSDGAAMAASQVEHRRLLVRCGSGVWRFDVDDGRFGEDEQVRQHCEDAQYRCERHHALRVHLVFSSCCRKK
jgi:hypothetical protein